MPDAPQASYSLLFGTDRSEVVPVVEEALRSAGIPFHAGLQADPAPRVVFSVPTSRLEEARGVVGQFFGVGPLAADALPDPAPGREPETDVQAEAAEEVPRFPWSALQLSGFLVLLHLSLVFGIVGVDPTPARLASVGGLVGALGLSEPWRLVTYLFIHSDPSHVLWNALSMVAFAVPLVGTLGTLRTAAIYLGSGIAGGLAALYAYPPGTVTVGSSGAVAGLFGAWLVGTLRSARLSRPTARRRLQVLGIGLLVLPTLVNPTTSEGVHISVAAHVGGALCGVVLGLLLGRRRVRPLAAGGAVG